MRKIWEIKEEVDPQTVENLANSLSIDKILAGLLIQRGISNYDESRYFFRPSLLDLHDPFLMKDMDLALDRIEDAIKAGESVLIYGDYDVDGTTSVAMMYTFFKAKFKKSDFYIPDRYIEGYGISIKGLDYAHKNGFSLIITLDCGIKAVSEIEYARKKGIDIIICDHHFPGDKIPEAVAIINPKQKDCNYPFKDLSGCGVGFKLLQGFTYRNDIQFKKLEVYLDLLCISIISDLVPITGENRILAYFGLHRLKTHPRLGINKLISSTSARSENISVNDIIFKIGPRINAAGRMDSGSKSVELLITKKEKSANELGNLIEEYNNSRKKLDSSITENALKQIKENEDLINRKTTVLYNKDWHKGVIGIVASRLIEVYYRPTIVLAKSNGLVTGSARSIEGFDIYEAIESLSEYLESFGGHKYAAGLTLLEENVSIFSEKFENIVSQSITVAQLQQKIVVDAIINLKDINAKFFRILKQFSPFGFKNPNPVFISNKITGRARAVGIDKEHLKLDLTEPDLGYFLPGIAFRQADKLNLIESGEPFHICYTIEENTFNNKTSIQLFILDILSEEEY